MKKHQGSNQLILSTVQSKSDLKTFIDLPWSIYGNDSCWVPPLKSSVAKLLDQRKHPFWQFSEGEYFLAYRNQKPVGRIAAFIDRNNNSYHAENIGGWGFFECQQDPEAAFQLFAKAERWVKERGMTAIRGPLNPSTNYEIGLLVEGFDKIPALMMTYNPAYYHEFIYAAGYRKEKDLFSYRITRDFKVPTWIFELSARLCEKYAITVKSPKKWKTEDIRLLFNIYKECWAENWGFVPTTEKEEDALASELIFLLEADLAFFVYLGDEPVAIGVMVPDFNPLLKRLNGNLGLSALFKKYMYQSEIKGLRGLLFGVRNKYRQLGLHLVSIQYVMNILQTLDKYYYAEMGWTLEDNEAINRLFAESGIEPDKRYRIFKKEL